MGTKRVLAIVATLAFVVVIINCATLGARRPEVRAVRPRITGIDFFGITMAFDVDVYNPNIFAIRSPRLKYAMNIEGSRLFASEITSPINLPANDEGMVTFPVRVSYFDLWRTYQSLVHASEANYRLDGAFVFPVAGRSLELPFSHGGTFPILRPPEFSDIKVHLTDVSPTNAKINVNALVKNPNVVPLGLENLGYAVKLGDIQLGDLVSSASGTLNPGQSARVSLVGEASAVNTLLNIVRGGTPGGTTIIPQGSIQTPYGPVKFHE
jgi:LEA14-like dessication related protein